MMYFDILRYQQLDIYSGLLKMLQWSPSPFLPSHTCKLTTLPAPAGVAHCNFEVGLVVAYFYEPASIWHTRCHYACFEMILSYHLLLFLIFSPINWCWLRHHSLVWVVFWLFVSVFVCCFVSWCFSGFSC